MSLNLKGGGDGIGWSVTAGQKSGGLMHGVHDCSGRLGGGRGLILPILCDHIRRIPEPI